MELGRRRFLRGSGGAMTLSTGLLAGCLGGDDSSGENADGERGGDGSTPAYARWLAWDDDATFYTYVDWAALEATDDVGDEADDWAEDGEGNDVLDSDDAMLALPMASIMFAAFVGGFGLLGTGLSGLLSVNAENEAESTSEVTEFESTIDEILMVNDAFVMLGDVRSDEIHEALTEEPEDDFSFKFEYERTDAIGEFEVYEPADPVNREQGGALAVGADAIVLANGTGGGNPVDYLRNPIEAYTGDGERAADRVEDFEWLLGRAGHGDAVLGGFGEFGDEEEIDTDEGDELEEFDGADGVVSSLTIEGETEWSGELAAVFDDLSAEIEAEFESTVGSSADEVSHEFDGNRATASATWSENPIEE